MRRRYMFIVHLIAAFVVIGADAADPVPVIVALLPEESSRPVYGERLRDNATHISISDLRNGQEKVFLKTSLKSLRIDISEQSVIDGVGLPNYVAWKINKLVPPAMDKGQIVHVDREAIHVSLGKQHGIQVGQDLIVYRVEGEILDPDTKEVLGKRRRTVGRLTTLDISEKVSTAATVNPADEELRVGDLVEPIASARSVAVLPFVDADGNETVGSRRIAEELTTGLVNRGVSVVERRLLDRVLTELKLHSSTAFDVTKSARTGKMLGAHALVVGTIARKQRHAEIQVRLVLTETGEVELAMSHVLADSDDLFKKVKGTTPELRGSFGKVDPPSASTLVLVTGTELIGLSIHTKGPGVGKELQSVVLRLTEVRQDELQAEWDSTAYASNALGKGSRKVTGLIRGNSVELKSEGFIGEGKLIDGALVIGWSNAPFFGENVFVPEGQYRNRSAMAGRYRISEGGKTAFELTLFRDGRATKSHAPGVTGKWQPLGSGALAVWTDGWRDVLTLNRGRLIKQAFSPGTSILGDHVNPGIASRIE